MARQRLLKLIIRTKDVAAATQSGWLWMWRGSWVSTCWLPGLPLQRHVWMLSCFSCWPLNLKLNLWTWLEAETAALSVWKLPLRAAGRSSGLDDNCVNQRDFLYLWRRSLPWWHHFCCRPKRRNWRTERFVYKKTMTHRFQRIQTHIHTHTCKITQNPKDSHRRTHTLVNNVKDCVVSYLGQNALKNIRSWMRSQRWTLPN